MAGFRRAGHICQVSSSLPGPSRLTMAKASSTEQYVRVYVSGLIKSLMLLPRGADKWSIVLQPPSCLGTKPKPEHQKFGRGGESKGPRTRLSEHSVTSALSRIDG